MPRKKISQVIDDEAKKIAEAEIKESQREIDYDLRDFTIDYIVKEFEKDRFYIPPYQRKYIWDDKTKVKFIESVILGLPIPFMFFADTDDGRLEIVDGAQRVQTLESFINNDFALSDLERLSSLNGFTFSDLPIAQQRKMENRALRVIILEDQTSVEIRQEIFNRINTEGRKVNPSEVRKGAFQGPFMDFINECAMDAQFRSLCPISQTLLARGEAQELVLRYFAYAEEYKKFKHDVAKFLNNYVIKNRTEFEKDRMKKEFYEMLQFVNRYFPAGFAKTKTAKATPRVRFEAISVGVTLALRSKPDLVPNSMEWLDSNEFSEQTTTHASNSGPRLQGRINYVRDMLLR